MPCHPHHTSLPPPSHLKLSSPQGPRSLLLAGKLSAAAYQVKLDLVEDSQIFPLNIFSNFFKKNVVGFFLFPLL